jgi:uncharacterized protein (TIGR04255 family)
MGERLKIPSVVEAICEFRFSTETPWDWTIPGQLYDHIRADFSERSQIQGMGLQVQVHGRPAGVPPVATIHTGPERVQLKRTDGSAMVQVGPHLLAVNHLRPYPQWEVFLSLILRMFNEYQGIAGQSVLQRIGLRYINQLALPPGSVDLGQLITLTPPLSGALDRPLQAFYQRYEIEQSRPEGVLVHQTGIQEVGGRPAILLDLDFVSTQVQALQSAEQVRQWLDDAHHCVYDAFVASLNPDLYERMKRGEA